MPSASSGPVSASNPVAYTMTSRSYWPAVVLIPVSVISWIGVARRSTSVTFGRLKVS